MADAREISIRCLIFLSFTNLGLAADDLSMWQQFVREGRQLRQEMKYEEAVNRFLTALRLAEVSAHQNGRLAATLNDLAAACNELGSYREARDYAQRSLDTLKRAEKETDPTFTSSLNNLAMAHVGLGRYQQAEKHLRHATELRIKQLGDSHPLVATSLMNLAGISVRLQRYAEAEPLYHRALAIWEKDIDHRADIARCLNNLAALYRLQKRTLEAVSALRRALALSEAIHGPQHPSWAMGAANLAAVYCEARDFGEAEGLLRRAILTLEKTVAPSHPDLIWMLSNYVYLLYQSNRATEAAALEKELDNRQKGSLSREHHVVDLSELLSFRQK